MSEQAKLRPPPSSQQNEYDDEIIANIAREVRFNQPREDTLEEESDYEDDDNSSNGERARPRAFSEAQTSIGSCSLSSHSNEDRAGHKNGAAKHLGLFQHSMQPSRSQGDLRKSANHSHGLGKDGNLSQSSRDIRGGLSRKILKFLKVGGRRQGFNRNSSNGIAGTSNSEQVEAKYFKLNASTRLARPKYSDKKPFQLLAKLPLEAFEVDRDNIRQDFGVRLRSEKNSVTALTLDSSLIDYDDLTKNQLTAIQQQAFDDLNAELHKLGAQHLVLKSMPKFAKRKTTAIFGANLVNLYQLDRKIQEQMNHGAKITNRKDKGNIELKCPTILKFMLDFLGKTGNQHEVGIFRISCQQNRIIELKKEVNDYYQKIYQAEVMLPIVREEVFAIFEKYSVHDVAALLKLFLRSLEQPLFPAELCEIFLFICGLPSYYQQMRCANLLVWLLHQSHRNVLFELLEMLHKIVENNRYNRMSLENIATVLAPNIFPDDVPIAKSSRPNSLSASTAPAANPASIAGINEVYMKRLERTQAAIRGLNFIINLYIILFHVPHKLYLSSKK